jgi:hypothetical protein
MNLKQLGILVVIVVVVVGAGLVLRNKQSNAWSGGSAEVGKKLLGDFPFNDVAHIAVKHGTNELNLVKKDDLWRVRERGDYPANFSQISEFLLKARDLKVIQSEEIGDSQLARMELARGQGSNSAVEVEFEDQSGKPIRTLLLGKKHMKTGQSAPSQFGGGDESFPDGRYVQVGTNAHTVALISDPLDNLDTQPAQWLNKDFIKVEKPKSIEVAFPETTNSWKLTRETETGDWKLADAKSGEELDSSKSSGVTSPFASGNFNDVLPHSAADQLGTNKPTTVKIQTFDGFDYTFTVGAKTNDDYPVTVAVAAQLSKERTAAKDEKPEEKTLLDKEFASAQQKFTDKLKQEQAYEKWVFLLPSYELDPLLKERSQLLVEKKEEPKTSAETNKLETAAPEMKP